MENNLQLVSVIIPYYKNYSSIVEALGSVVNQTYKPLEIILVNDASPDWELARPSIEALNIKDIKIISHAINKNGAAARNTGIKNSKGEYIAFLDADDLWNPIHIESSLKKLLADGGDLVYCKSEIQSVHHYILPTRPISRDESIGDYLFVHKEAIYTPTFFMRSPIAKALLFTETLKRHQDYDFLLRFERHGYKLSMSDHIGAVIRWQPDNSVKKGETWILSYEWAIAYKTFLSKRAYSNFIAQFVVRKLINEGKFGKALSVFKKEISMAAISRKNWFLLLYTLGNKLKK